MKAARIIKYINANAKNNIGAIIDNFAERRSFLEPSKEATKSALDYLVDNLKTPCQCHEVPKRILLYATIINVTYIERQPGRHAPAGGHRVKNIQKPIT